jgi:hypothetical protein
MRKLRSRSFQPSILALEGRRLMAARLPTSGDDPGPAPPPVQTAPQFDTTLTIDTVTDRRVNPATACIVVDGSGHDDHIQIRDDKPGQRVTVQLGKWSNGVRATTGSILCSGKPVVS